MIAIAFAFASHCLLLIFSFTAEAAADDLTPGRSFRDCPICPEMVVVPVGSFDMGAAQAETDRQPVGRFIERPQRRVRIARSNGVRIARALQVRPR